MAHEYKDNDGYKFTYYRLKECPFCGSLPEINFIGNNFTKSRKVEITCSDKKCSCRITTAGIHSNHEQVAKWSIDKWNKRFE